MNVLVTGGTGIISSGVVKESVRQGFTTYAITRGNHDFRNIEGVNYIKANVWNKKEIEKIMSRLEIDIVVECLVYTPQQLKISLENFAKKCKQYVFISTTAIYNNPKGKVNEEAEQNPTEWEYTKDKIQCEKMARDYYKDINNDSNVTHYEIGETYIRACPHLKNWF